MAFNSRTYHFCFSTYNRHLKKCLLDYGTRDYSEWVLAHPGQAVLTVVSNKPLPTILIYCFGFGQIIPWKCCKEHLNPFTPKSAKFKTEGKNIELNFAKLSKTYNTTWKYCSIGFIWMVTLKGFIHRLKRSHFWAPCCKGATWRMMNLETFSLIFSSSSFVIRLNLPQSFPSLFLFGLILRVWCFSILVNYYCTFNCPLWAAKFDWRNSKRDHIYWVDKQWPISIALKW